MSFVMYSIIMDRVRYNRDRRIRLILLTELVAGRRDIRSERGEDHRDRLEISRTLSMCVRLGGGSNIDVVMVVTMSSSDNRGEQGESSGRDKSEDAE